ncbi:unnamed protein product [Effrenium voratum]|nr:unnamed protein product [Effrenium voratum]
MAGPPPEPGDGALSSFLACTAIVKALLGFAALTLPSNFQHTHAVLGLTVLGVVGSALGLGTYRVAQCSLKLQSKDPNASDVLGPVGQISMEVFGRHGRNVCLVCAVIAQFSFCTAYINTITTTLQRMFDIPRIVLQVGLCVVLCAQSLIRDLIGVAWLSVLGMAAYMYIVAALLHFGIAEIGEGRDALEAAWLPVRWEGLGYLVGPAISAFEGVLVSQYVFVQMKLSDPAPFGRVVIVSHLLALLIFGFIGAFGFGIYGSRVEDATWSQLSELSLVKQNPRLHNFFVA